MLLLIDFYEKTAISSKRRAQMTKVHNVVYMVGRLLCFLRQESTRIKEGRVIENVKVSDQGKKSLEGSW